MDCLCYRFENGFRKRLCQMFQNLTVFVSILKTVPAISRGGFYFLHQFIAFTDMKIVYKRNPKDSGTIDSVFVRQAKISLPQTIWNFGYVTVNGVNSNVFLT